MEVFLFFNQRASQRYRLFYFRTKRCLERPRAAVYVKELREVTRRPLGKGENTKLSCLFTQRAEIKAKATKSLVLSNSVDACRVCSRKISQQLFPRGIHGKFNKNGNTHPRRDPKRRRIKHLLSHIHKVNQEKNHLHSLRFFFFTISW
jgi:hypothetical protein